MFNTFVQNPIFETLVFIYQNVALENLGLAIIILTILIRVALFPLFFKGAKSQTVMQKIQPKIKKLREKHKDDKEKQAKEMMALYKKHNINPLSGIAVLLVQIPVFFALFRIFRDSELLVQTFAHTSFLAGLIPLSEASIPLTLAASGLQYFQGKLTMAGREDGASGDSSSPMAGVGKAMIYAGPAISFIILFRLPSALALYWVMNAAFSTGQQFIINKKIKKGEELQDKIDKQEKPQSEDAKKNKES